jgi:prepilin-type N-terminal cleavage/methylation domain-containing protein
MREGVSSIRNLIIDERGLTLVELMIVLVLSLFLMAAVYMTFQVQKSTSDTQQEVVAVQQDVRAVLDIMARDIRLAGCDPTMGSNAGLTAAQSGTDRITFTMDLNEDGDTLDTDEAVSYSYAGTVLTRTVSGVATVLTDRATGFALEYRNGSNAVVNPTGGGGAFLTDAEAGTVRSVEVTLELQSRKRDVDINDFIRRSMTRQLRMRNLGL